MRAIILVADGAEDLETFYPLYRLKESGFTVDVAGAKIEPVTCKHGYTITPNKTFAQLKTKDYDLLIIPGGRAPESIRLDPKALVFTKSMFHSDKVVASICHGIQVLISAGLVGDRSLTCWKGVRDDLKMAGGRYVDADVVIDGRLVTSRSPDDLPAFCRGIYKALGLGAGVRKETRVARAA